MEVPKKGRSTGAAEAISLRPESKNKMTNERAAVIVSISEPYHSYMEKFMPLGVDVVFDFDETYNRYLNKFMTQEVAIKLAHFIENKNSYSKERKSIEVDNHIRMINSFLIPKLKDEFSRLVKLKDNGNDLSVEKHILREMKEIMTLAICIENWKL